MQFLYFIFDLFLISQKEKNIMWSDGHSFVFTSPVKSSMCEQLAHGDGEIRKYEIGKDSKQGFYALSLLYSAIRFWYKYCGWY
jgi:hypothetical protein